MERLKSLLTLYIVSVGIGLSPYTQAETSTSALSSIYDPGGHISHELTQALEAIAIEQSQVGDQRILLAIFDDTGGSTEKAVSQKYFSESKKIQTGLLVNNSKDTRILISIFWKEKSADLEMGLGLDSIVSKKELQGIVKSTLVPFLKKKKASTGIIRTYIKILQALESPLVPSGKAELILKSWNSDSTELQSEAGAHFSVFSIVLIVLAAFLIFGWMGYLISSVEWHVSHEGAMRINPVSRWIYDLKARFVGGKSKKTQEADLGGSIANW